MKKITKKQIIALLCNGDSSMLKEVKRMRAETKIEYLISK